MASTTNIVKGIAINFKHGSWLISEAQFVNPGKGAAFTRTKLKNLKTGQVIEHTFRSGESVELIDVARKKAQYLYKDNESFYFMDNETYEQFQLENTAIGDNSRFLVDGTEVYVLHIDANPISIQLPPKMDFKVTQAPPGVKGDTATGGSKEVTMETGTTIKVPLFIKEGEIIKINTDDGSYISKA